MHESDPEDAWYYAVGEQQVGPVSLAEIREHVAAGRIAPSTFIWREGWENWVEARDVPEVRPAAPASSHYRAATLDYAGFWNRAAAWLIDMLVIGGIAGILGIRGRSTDLVYFVLFWPYYALLESSNLQGTLGKAALKLIVTDANGRRISFARASGRYVARLLSIATIGIGFLIAGVTQRKQALHDLVADTLVVHNPRG